MNEKETQVMARMQEYLTKDILPSDLALYFRRLKLEVVRLVLSAEPDTFDKEWIVDGLYFLDSICEILDPYLELEK